MPLTSSFAALVLALGMVGAGFVHPVDPAAAASEAERAAGGRGARLGIASRDPDIEPGADIARLQAAGASWAYAWRYRKLAPRTRDFDVVPMIRSAASFSDTTVDVLRQARADGDFRYLLGFNEPDNANQADLTPRQAADLWPRLQQTGLVLGSPSPAVATNGWLDQFMAIAERRGYRVDFVALHFYADLGDTAAVSRIRKQVRAVRRAHGKPIWITEIGILDGRPSDGGSERTGSARAARQMRALTRMLDGLPYVQRVAWVTDDAGPHTHLRSSALYDDRGRLSPLGRSYAALR